MNAADRLIVALDVPASEAFGLWKRLCVFACGFKLGPSALLQRDGLHLAHHIVQGGNCFLLDLKLYDTADTVRRTMEAVAKLGAAMVTVHADCAEHALGFGPKVLAVDRLTDNGYRPKPFTRSAMKADGIVCHAMSARWHQEAAGPDKIIVCPSVRPAGIASDNHILPATPRQAINAGADYIIIGRPIYAASDPVAAARAITLEIEAALAERSP